MSEDDRREWLVAARGTLAGIPADLLERGCRRARESCDHPSKVVPAILAEVRRAWDWRRESRVEAGQPKLPPPTRHLMDRRGETMTEAETEELNQILEHIGATTRYRPDGSRTQVDAQAGKRQADTPRRKSTRADYIALGVDPATLDAISGAQH